MTLLPSRSDETELTKDELLLLDFLFDGGAAIGLMQRDAYHAHMNIRYTHSLTDANLLRVLRSLVERGLLRAAPDDPNTKRVVYWFTECGGAYWSRERMPVWERYCTSFTGSDAPALLDVLCVEQAIGRDFLCAAQKTGYIRILDDIKQVQWKPLDPRELIYWRPVDAAWQAKVQIQSEVDPEWNRWDDLNAGRTWWNSIEELQSFLPQQPPA